MSYQAFTENTIIIEKQPIIDTDSSLNQNQTIKQEIISSSKYSKKRVGPYSYKLNNIIGSGYTSTVYKGIRDNDKSKVVAIKVVNLNNMKHHRKHLLDNQIKILKKLDHPNVLAFQDLYYTLNNCYIITEYCEGGSLEQALSTCKNFDWRRAAYEVSIACQYLASMNIIHRDIKPANVLIKNGVFKLCDLGFSCQFRSDKPKIKEDYLIGSPLYMPIESISDYVYSTKSDSFALGVVLYYITSKKFPWRGKTKTQLVQSYKHNEYNKENIANLAPRVKHLINSLLEIDCQKRMPLVACDFDVFLHLGPPKKIEDQIGSLKQCYSEQLKLCEYINSIRRHSDDFSWANQFLKRFIDRHLSSLTVAFEWHNQKALNQVKESYNLPYNFQPFDSDDYYWLNNCLKDTIKVLSNHFQHISTVLLEKLLNYQHIIEAFLFESSNHLIRCINDLVIHSTFNLVRPDLIFISKSLGKIDYFDL